METVRLEGQPTAGELRWYAASICRVASYNLEQRKIKPTEIEYRIALNCPIRFFIKIGGDIFWDFKSQVL